MRWIREHRGLVILLVLFTVIVPAAAGFLTTYIAEKEPIVILASLVGAWPDVNPTVVRSIGPWIGIGVGVSALSVFGIPTILGVIVTILLERVERKINMNVLDYLSQRDKFIETEIYSKFRDKVRDDITRQQCRDLAREAVNEAAAEWKRATDENISQRLKELEVGSPEENG